MKVDRQLNLQDRTLLLGVADYDAVPKFVAVNGSVFKVLGLSFGVKPPFLSVEIEKTDIELTNKTISEAGSI